jgi:hypothetical protein
MMEKTSSHHGDQKAVKREYWKGPRQYIAPKDTPIVTYFLQ